MQFLRDIHASACKVFGTVLGPEANNAHRNHFHVDMAKRQSLVVLRMRLAPRSTARRLPDTASARRATCCAFAVRGAAPMTTAAPRVARALISVYDKAGMVELAQKLVAHGVTLLSTGGSAAALKQAGIAGHGRVRRDRLSRDDGRAREDAAPEDPWRPARPARRARAHGRGEGATASA